MFSDVRAAYECVDLSGATPQPLTRCPLNPAGARLRVTHLATIGDGMDIVENVENLLFSDSAAPLAPTTVTAQAFNASARVTFQPPPSIIDSYEVQPLDVSGADVGAPVVIADPDLASVLVTGLTNGQTYRFKVRGRNAFGNGEWSENSNAVTPGAEAPGRPGLPTLAPGNGRVAASWAAPGNNGGSPITGYEVRVTDLEGLQVGGLRPSPDRTLTVTGLTNGTEYFFEVRAINAQGAGPWTTPIGAVPATQPGAPQLVSVSPRNHGALVAWEHPADDGGRAVTRFLVQVRTLSGQQVGALRSADRFANRLRVTGLKNGRTYTFRVRAENSMGASAWSNVMRARPRN
jgi:hypothetical protein